MFDEEVKSLVTAWWKTHEKTSVVQTRRWQLQEDRKGQRLLIVSIVIWEVKIGKETDLEKK